jgi:hypothetical protein
MVNESTLEEAAEIRALLDNRSTESSHKRALGVLAPLHQAQVNTLRSKDGIETPSPAGNTPLNPAHSRPSSTTLTKLPVEVSLTHANCCSATKLAILAHWVC